jgi:hypothetical protein
MKQKAYAYGFGALFAFGILAMALTGTATVKVQETCVDGINNDGDVISGLNVPLIDIGESSCIYMPFSFAPGEIFPDGLNAVQFQNELPTYLLEWDHAYAEDRNKFTHYDALVVLSQESQDPTGFMCSNQIVEESFIYWRAQGVSSEQSGILQHQAFCNTTY